jgi:hypothetical protein
MYNIVAILAYVQHNYSKMMSLFFGWGLGWLLAVRPEIEGTDYEQFSDVRIIIRVTGRRRCCGRATECIRGLACPLQT